MRNHIKLLSDEQRKLFNERYKFKILQDYIIVNTNVIKKPILHNKCESFNISIVDRKLTITPKAIELWEKLSFEYSLIDVQCSLNQLELMYQTPDIEDVKLIIKQFK